MAVSSEPSVVMAVSSEPSVVMTVSTVERAKCCDDSAERDDEAIGSSQRGPDEGEEKTIGRAMAGEHRQLLRDPQTDHPGQQTGLEAADLQGEHWPAVETMIFHLKKLTFPFRKKENPFQKIKFCLASAVKATKSKSYFYFCIDTNYYHY